MSQGVDKLKELLFDSENQALSELQNRQADIRQRLDAVFERAGTDERLRTSVATVLDGALRTAEIERHAQLSQAIAPLVVSTIKTEIHNSQDELVEALYPITGRLVSSYVSSAMKDLMKQVNQRLEHNPFTLRIKSVMTGRSMAEIALAETQNLNTEEIYLIRRGSGELIARWPSAAGKSNQDHVMSGILTAINEFATEAFNAEGTTLRMIDLGDACVYLRASPTYLVAAKCEGSAPASIEQVIDEAFLETIEQHHDSLDINPGALGAAGTTAGQTKEDEAAKILSHLAETLNSRISRKQEQLVSLPFGIKPVSFATSLLLACICAVMAWSLYYNFTTERVRTLATGIIDRSAELRGYPTRLTVAPYGEAITLAGLAPNNDAKSQVIARLQNILPTTKINDQIALLPEAPRDTGPEVAQLRSAIANLRENVTGMNDNITGLRTNVRTDIAGLRSHIDRRLLLHSTKQSQERLVKALPVLTGLADLTIDDAGKQTASETAASVQQVRAKLETLRTTAADSATSTEALQTLAAPLNDLAAELRGANQQLSGLLTGSAIATSLEPASPPIPSRPSDENDQSGTISAEVAAAQSLAAETERLSALVLAATNAVQSRQNAIQTPFEILDKWARTNAVFFSTATDYRNTAQTKKTLDEAAALITKAEILVRVVGYTDLRGQDDDNTSLSQRRADKVYRELLSRGVPQRLLAAVGRRDARDLSAAVGAGTPNRRVEFEIGFNGESAR